MSVKDYLRASVWDFVICLAAAVALGFANCGAFYVSSSLQYSPVALIIAAGVPLLLLFFSAYSKRTVAIGIPAAVLLLVIACAVAAAAAHTKSIIADTASNPVIFILVMYLSAVLTFLLTRRRWLARIFVVAATLDVCYVEFMYKQGHLWALLVVLAAAGVMVVYRNYRSNLKDASADKVSFTSSISIAAGYIAVMLGIACLIFFLIIAPLHPGALEFKPFEKHMTFETVDMTGVGDVKTVDDPSKTTGNTNQNQKKTKQQNQDDSKKQSGVKDQMSAVQQKDTTDTVSGTGPSLFTQMYNFVIKQPLTALFILILLILVVFVAPFVIKKRLRARWFAKTCALPPNQCVEQFFIFCMKRFKILKITKPENATLSEFAVSSKGALAEFSVNELEVPFAHIIALYSASVYGGVQLDQEDIDCVKSFYAGFYKAFVQKSGRLRYIFRFFRV